ncbi:hypothetical protein HAZT_HAZT000633 [Hyalella azteca]|uniref:Uncharacterized protein n=1 Tax=Hyalella azteca TaxID=294128 RepID=A0A6A0HCH0_HYAAZ|nr:hypothetical protein HAZT_HAZT000633 [Hyalella azteca]
MNKKMHENNKQHANQQLHDNYQEQAKQPQLAELHEQKEYPYKRVLTAAGYAQSTFDPDRTSTYSQTTENKAKYRKVSYEDRPGTHFTEHPDENLQSMKSSVSPESNHKDYYSRKYVPGARANIPVQESRERAREQRRCLEVKRLALDHDTELIRNSFAEYGLEADYFLHSYMLGESCNSSNNASQSSVCDPFSRGGPFGMGDRSRGGMGDMQSFHTNGTLHITAYGAKDHPNSDAELPFPHRDGKIRQSLHFSLVADVASPCLVSSTVRFETCYSSSQFPHLTNVVKLETSKSDLPASGSALHQLPSIVKMDYQELGFAIAKEIVSTTTGEVGISSLETNDPSCRETIDLSSLETIELSCGEMSIVSSSEGVTSMCHDEPFAINHRAAKVPHLGATCSKYHQACAGYRCEPTNHVVSPAVDAAGHAAVGSLPRRIGKISCSELMDPSYEYKNAATFSCLKVA